MSTSTTQVQTNKTTKKDNTSSSLPLQFFDPELAPDADVNHIDFTFEEFVKNELKIRVDQDSQICKDFVSGGNCPRGGTCPLRHVAPSPLNFRPSSPTPISAHARTVCKHWLRGLCKKGITCEYLHEYNLRKMPECWFYGKFGYCSSGDECMYLHVGPQVRRGECKAYTRGFCPLGPNCPQKHVRKIICPRYLAGFCPEGLECSQAHPPFDFDKVEEYIKRGTTDDKELYRNRDREWPEEEGGGYQSSGNKKRNMDDVLCFKCGQHGHFANSCPNPSVPGLRGGVERGPGGIEIRTSNK